MRLCKFLAVLLPWFAIALLSTSAFSQPQIVQTNCDTLSLDPLQVRITFAVINPDPFLVCKIRFTPLDSEDPPADACPISECDGPDPWYCLGPGGPTVWEGLALPPDELRGCVEQGETQDGFSIVIQPNHCCFHVAFFEPFVLQPFYWEIFCLDCDRAVQVDPGSWGQLKSIYR